MVEGSRGGGRRAARAGRPAGSGSGHGGRTSAGLEIGRTGSRAAVRPGRAGLDSRRSAPWRDRLRRRTSGAAAGRRHRTAAPRRSGTRVAAGRRRGESGHRRGGRHRTARYGAARWTGLRLGDRLGGPSAVRCWCENDANAAAVAEHWKGAAAGSDDMVFVLAGLSPGAGSLIGGGCTAGSAGRPVRSGAASAGREATPETLLSTTGEPLHPLDEAGGHQGLRVGPRRGRTGTCQAVDRFSSGWCTTSRRWCWCSIPELVVVGGWAAGLAGRVEPLRGKLARYCLRPPQVTSSRLWGGGRGDGGACGSRWITSRRNCSRWRGR